MKALLREKVELSTPFAILIVSFLKFHICRVGASTSRRNSLGNTPDLWLAQGAHPHIPFVIASSTPLYLYA
jgi:hypothetical protein